MRKKIILLVLLISALMVLGSVSTKIRKINQDSQQVLNGKKTVISTIPEKKIITEKKSIFLPYWDLEDTSNLNNYDEVYYFGISATSKGVNKSEEGYRNIPKLFEHGDFKNMYLTLRLLDTDENIEILKSKKVQAEIISETIEVAEENGFKGIVLDLELGVLPFTEVVEQINSFTSDFYKESKIQNFTFLQAIYGDVFYRKRPFDVKYLSQNSDGILIMAYDFHKARGEPGPNFPFAGKEKYGYDFQQMVSDFIQVVPPEKLTVIFGMYGYDWITDMAGNSKQQGTSISLNEINQKYVAKCEWKNCVFRRDPKAAEVEINYVDSTTASYLIYHKLWYEDQKSVAKKLEFMKEKGIGSYGYWAHGYF